MRSLMRPDPVGVMCRHCDMSIATSSMLGSRLVLVCLHPKMIEHANVNLEDRGLRPDTDSLAITDSNICRLCPMWTPPDKDSV